LDRGIRRTDDSRVRDIRSLGGKQTCAQENAQTQNDSGFAPKKAGIEPIRPPILPLAMLVFHNLLKFMMPLGSI
jgi:hypothetical protein